MDSLRDDVGRAMYSSFGSIYRDLYDEESGEYSYDEFIADGGWITDEDTYSVDVDHFTRMRDAAIAAFESVLLSDEVVEAAAKGMWDSDMEAESDSHIPWDECGPHQEPWREEERHQARAALQAAITAAKGTEGSE